MSQIDRLLSAYETAILSPFPTSSVLRGSLTDFLRWGVANGYLTLIEQKNSYRFGGVTADLTDTELADIMRELTNGRKIAAIKFMRCECATGLTLKEAKDFVDHLNIIVQKVSASQTHNLD